MKTITTKIAKELIDQALKTGKSNQMIIPDADMKYLRLLVSRYNMSNGTKIAVNRVHNVYGELSAPYDRYYDHPDLKPTFDLIQNVLTNDNFVLNEEQSDMITDKLKSIAETCKMRVPKITEEKKIYSDLLK